MLFCYRIDILVGMTETPKSLYDEFLRMESRDEIAEQVSGLLSTRCPLQQVGQGLRGRLFAELAYQYLRRNFEAFSTRVLTQFTGGGPDRVFLSPGETFQLFDATHTTNTTANHPNLNPGIPNTSFPDGVILQRSARDTYFHLIGLIEYKQALTPREARQMESLLNPHHIESTLGLFTPKGRRRLGQVLHEIDPRLVPLPIMVNPRYNLIYGVPDNTGLVQAVRQMSTAHGSDKARVKVVAIPVGRNPLYQCAERIISEVSAILNTHNPQDVTN